MASSWPNASWAASPTPSVSILTPTYNRLTFLPKLANCIAAQTYSKDHMEWVILDDGSESAAAVVATIRDKHKELRIR